MIGIAVCLAALAISAPGLPPSGGQLNDEDGSALVRFEHGVALSTDDTLIDLSGRVTLTGWLTRHRDEVQSETGFGYGPVARITRKRGSVDVLFGFPASPHPQAQTLAGRSIFWWRRVFLPRTGAARKECVVEFKKAPFPNARDELRSWEVPAVCRSAESPKDAVACHSGNMEVEVPITKLFINALAGDVASRRELERVIEGNEKTGPKGLVLDAGVGAFMTHLHWLEIVDMECPIPSKPAERPKDTQ